MLTEVRAQQRWLIWVGTTLLPEALKTSEVEMESDSLNTLQIKISLRRQFLQGGFWQEQQLLQRHLCLHLKSE